MNSSRIVGIALMLGLALGAPASAATPLKLVQHLEITLPDWIAYAAITPTGIQKSPGGGLRSVADGLILQAEGQNGGEDVAISLHDGTSYLGAIPNPSSNDFPLNLFGEALEKRALRGGVVGSTIQRINLAKNLLPDGSRVIDHEFTITVNGSPEKSIHRHDVFLFTGAGTAVLEIAYPETMDGKWGSDLKAVALSFRLAP